MAHELFPKADKQALSFDDVIRRLRDSFAHVQLDTARASRELEESAQYMARAGSPHFDQEDVDRARRSIGRASYVIVADDPNADLAYLSFLLEPDHEKIFIDYESRLHEEMSQTLRERLARVLDYDLELV
jgi:hypothetical protein